VAATHPNVAGEVFNIGCGQQTSLNMLFAEICRITGTHMKPDYQPVRAGDVRHSVADISKAKKMLDYSPKVTIQEGLSRVLDWYGKQTEHSHVTS
jgi:nucleoside-diphosphate-sugar epimerase